MPVVRVLLVLLASGALAAQGPALKTIEPGDMNPSANPCDDFFEYANGGWRARNPIPSSMSRWSRRWKAGEENKEALKEILDTLAAQTNAPQGSVEQVTGGFYAACMDETRANELGVKPLQPLLQQIDGMKTSADVQAMIRTLHAMGLGVPFGLDARPDNDEPARTIAQISAGGLGMPDRDYYFKTEERFQKTREQYRAYVTTIFTLAGATDAQAKDAAATVFAIETSLADASLDNVALRDPQATNHKTAFAALQKMTPHLDWTAYFEQAAVPRADLNVRQPKFMAAVDRALADVPVADWKTYLKWQLLNAAAPSLSQPFVDANFRFYEAHLGGATEMKRRWKRCVEQEDELLGEALGQKYVEKHFPPAAKARIQQLVRNELLAMRDIVEGLDWMSADTKKQALEKLSTFNPKVGYPDKWRDYSQVPISRTDYWADIVAAHRADVAFHRSLIGKPTDRGLWGMTPPTSDAYYNPLLNEIVFPAGILQPPAFSADNVDAVNYGAIGVVIGHEISHGFDDEGAQYDAQGRLHNWWAPDDHKRFEARTACVVDQFDNYYIEPTVHHNGRLVLGEAIGDLAGTRIAYLAFQKAQQRTPAPTLAGFTPDQQFFIAWGQFRGDAVRPEFARMMVQGDPHPIAKFRVIGPLSNLPAFAQAFTCKPGSPMVRPPEKRCEVW